MRSDRAGTAGTRAPRPPRRSVAVATLLAVVAALAVAAAPGAAKTKPKPTKLSGKLTVFAAASLNGVFDKLGKMFMKANPKVKVVFNFAGSPTLSTQITQGAPADVFASASTASMTPITQAKLNKGKPTLFAANKGEIMVAKGNPLDIHSVAALANPAIKLVLCDPSVPCGALAQQIFMNAGVTPIPPANTVSLQLDVSSVVTQIVTGNADAGIVYVTDVKANQSKIQGVPIGGKNLIAGYPIVALKASKNPAAAAAWVKYVEGPVGQKALRSFGFLKPSAVNTTA